MTGQIAFEHISLELLSDAQVQLRRLALAHVLGERYQTLQVLGQSVKSLVCAGWCAAAEISGYILFRSGPIATVLYQDALHQVLVLEYLHGRLPIPADLPDVIAAYAAMHAAALANIQLAVGHRSTPDFLDPCLSSLCCFPSFDLQSISVGDCKPEHLLVTADGVRIIDLETHSLQRSVWFDILSLSRFMDVDMAFSSSLERWLAHYCACRGIPVYYYDLLKIRDCLQRVLALEPGKVYYEETMQ